MLNFYYITGFHVVNVNKLLQTDLTAGKNKMLKISIADKLLKSL